ncbi:extracellular solute-binding protein, partial [Candidatus Bipolaricaulota bacterium]|nr:extracellular solute-binding protein [Candidatus Bipolaricaulota bacterium]
LICPVAGVHSNLGKQAAVVTITIKEVRGALFVPAIVTYRCNDIIRWEVDSSVKQLCPQNARDDVKVQLFSTAAGGKWPNGLAGIIEIKVGDSASITALDCRVYDYIVKVVNGSTPITRCASKGGRFLICTDEKQDPTVDSVTLTPNINATLILAISGSDDDGDLRSLRGHVFQYAARADYPDKIANRIAVFDVAYGGICQDSQSRTIPCVLDTWYTGRGIAVDFDDNIDIKDTVLVLCQRGTVTQIAIRCRAKPPMEDWRGNNFLLAAEQLNADLEAAGDPRRVEVEIIQDNIGWGDYVAEFVLSYGAGEAPDIWLTGHEYIGVQAEAGRIVALDELMNDFPGFDNVIDNLWDSTIYKGEIWGVPQDAEARPLYFNKALLGELGWTASEIAALPEKIEKGEFTLYDMLAVAKEAVDKGVVADGNGFWTRPKNGPDFTAFYYAFGGETIDTATGKLVFDEAAGLRYYQFFYDAAQTYGSMGGLALSWSIWHGTITDGKVLFWVGGTWHWPDWAEFYLQELGGEDYMWETFGFGLIPAAELGGAPNSLTHPMAYLISSQCEHPDLALALIDKVTDYGPNTRHAIASTHLGILKGQTEYEPYAEARFLSETLYMLDYTTFLPNNPYWGLYSTITYEALAATVGGTFTPPGGGGLCGGWPPT